jgi:hypothetical protein
MGDLVTVDQLRIDKGNSQKVLDDFNTWIGNNILGLGPREHNVKGWFSSNTELKSVDDIQRGINDIQNAIIHNTENNKTLSHESITAVYSAMLLIIEYFINPRFSTQYTRNNLVKIASVIRNNDYSFSPRRIAKSGAMAVVGAASTVKAMYSYWLYYELTNLSRSFGEIGRLLVSSDLQTVAFAAPKINVDDRFFEVADDLLDSLGIYSMFVDSSMLNRLRDFANAQGEGGGRLDELSRIRGGNFDSRGEIGGFLADRGFEPRIDTGGYLQLGKPGMVDDSSTQMMLPPGVDTSDPDFIDGVGIFVQAIENGKQYAMDAVSGVFGEDSVNAVTKMFNFAKENEFYNVDGAQDLADDVNENIARAIKYCDNIIEMTSFLMNFIFMMFAAILIWKLIGSTVVGRGRTMWEKRNVRERQKRLRFGRRRRRRFMRSKRR